MEIKHIKELMAVMGRTGTSRLMIKKEGFELMLERQENGRIIDSFTDSGEELTVRQESALPRSTMSIPREREKPSGSPGSQVNETLADASSVYVTSPMVGTFYSSPSPEDPSFIKPGDKVEKHTVVCIIEAMKVMNEVKAGVSGTVAEVLIESGHPVEFGTKLFRII